MKHTYEAWANFTTRGYPVTNIGGKTPLLYSSRKRAKDQSWHKWTQKRVRVTIETIDTPTPTTPEEARDE